MITELRITNNKKSPFYYINELKCFRNGKKYTFHEGINIIVGENGCGKTTLMKLLEAYLMVGYNECERGSYASNIRRLFGYKDALLDGVDVYADYTKNTFRLSHAGEKEKGHDINTFNDFQNLLDQKHSSTGEGVIIALNSLFNYMFGRDAKLKFDYSQFNDEWYSAYYDYVVVHTVNCSDAWTILMDEPDRNLSLDNIEHIQNILSYKKPQTQIIAVIHNPLIIYTLSKNKDIHFIEMTKGYIKKVRTIINNLTK